MAYAAALNDLAPAWFDTRSPVQAHPMFPVCLEWPAVVESRQLMKAAGLLDDEQRRAIHAAHDLLIQRPIVTGETLTTLATIVGVEQKSPGTFCTTRLDTTDAGGALVCRTYQLALMRGVNLQGESGWLEQVPALPVRPSALAWTRLPINVATNAAHVYTECARIWNPIHTDRAVAVAAGLPDIILHGTMTLALAISSLMAALGADGSVRLHRLGGRFASMVFMPARLSLEFAPGSPGEFHFRVLNEDGSEAIRDGFLVCGKHQAAASIR